jgi:opacity protein-like surface antigen
MTNVVLINDNFAQGYAVGAGIDFAAANDNVDSAPGFYGHFDYIFVNLSIVARAEFGGYSSSARTDPNKKTVLISGDYSMKWLELSGMLKSPNPKTQPFAGIGFGYYFLNYSISDAQRRNSEENGIILANEKLDNAFGAHAKAGINLIIAPAVFIKLELKYVYLKTDLNLDITDITSSTAEKNQISENPNLSTVFVGAGLIVAL